MTQISVRSEYDPFVWRYLEQRIRDYLSEGGMPADQAGRTASMIIVECATGADSLSGDAIGEHAFNEAHLQLEGWRARRSDMLAAAA